MKLFFAVSALLCTCTLVQSRLSFSDLAETAKEFFDEIVDSLGVNHVDNSKNDDDTEADGDGHIDMGDGNFIAIRSFHEIEKRGKKKEKTPEEIEADRKAEREFTDEDGDYLKHDCLNIKEYTRENWEAEEWNKGTSRKRFIQKRKTRKYVKYNSAYGIPMIGTVLRNLSDASMLRGCYLLRYIFADNQHLRIAARRRGMYNEGYRGGRCCPPQMADNGLSCQCNSKFPQLGKGAPAHEMAHYFIKYLMNGLMKDGRMILPEYVNQENKWTYRPGVPESDGSKKCNANEKLVKKYGKFYIWVWNAQKNDKLRKRTKTDMCKMHHYMIYAGQQNWLFKGNKKVMDLSRPCFKRKSINLYNLMEKIWPCGNIYTAVCKDAAYGFQWGLSQKMNIGKSRDPADISKMTCEDIDDPQVKRADLLLKLPTDQPTEDRASKEKCRKIARSVNKELFQEGQERSFKVNEWATYLRSDKEYPWYLRRCCAGSLNFDNSVPQNEQEDPEFKYKDGTCRGDLFDEDDEETMNEDDYDEIADEEEEEGEEEGEEGGEEEGDEGGEEGKKEEE